VKHDFCANSETSDILLHHVTPNNTHQYNMTLMGFKAFNVTMAKYPRVCIVSTAPTHHIGYGTMISFSYK